MAEWYALARIGQGSDAFKKSVTLDLTKLPQDIRDLFRPTNKQRINFDFVQTKDGIIYEVKAGYPNGAVDLDQMHNYNLLVARSKELDEDFLGLLATINVEDLESVKYIMMPGNLDQIESVGTMAGRIGADYVDNIEVQFFDQFGSLK